jgi:hypothetical protein
MVRRDLVLALPGKRGYSRETSRLAAQRRQEKGNTFISAVEVMVNHHPGYHPAQQLPHSLIQCSWTTHRAYFTTTLDQQKQSKPYSDAAAAACCSPTNTGWVGPAPAVRQIQEGCLQNTLYSPRAQPTLLTTAGSLPTTHISQHSAHAPALELAPLLLPLFPLLAPPAPRTSAHDRCCRCCSCGARPVAAAVQGGQEQQPYLSLTGTCPVPGSGWSWAQHQ